VRSPEGQPLAFLTMHGLSAAAAEPGGQGKEIQLFRSVTRHLP